jgi:hypothetical protein
MVGSSLSIFTFPYKSSNNPQLGVGVNLLTANAMGETAFGSIAVLTGEQANFELIQQHYVCSTQNDYSEKQETNLRLDGSKDTIKAGAGLDLLNQTRVTSKSVVAVSIGSIHNRVDQYDPSVAKLSGVAKGILLDRGPEEFTRRFGTHFMGGYVYGANFYSYISVVSRTSTDREKVKVAINASYNEDMTESAEEADDATETKPKSESGSGSASWRREKVITETESTVDAKLLVSGIVQVLKIADFKAVAKAFAKFSVDAQKAPVPIMVQAIPYTMIPEVQSLMAKHYPTRSLVPEISESVVEALRREYRRTNRIKEEINEYDRIAYGLPSLVKINETAKRALGNEIDAINSLTIPQLADPGAKFRGWLGLDDSTIPVRSSEIRAAWEVAFKREYSANI